MMIQHNFQPKIKSIKIWLGMTALTLLLLACGGGGSGGPQALTPDEPDPPENKLPVASITSPTQAQFNEGENIAFGGTATDEEDGQLEGASLVWTSSVDGLLGNGPAITTSALTAGPHDITLSATDSQGGAHTTPPIQINIAQTRFIKMGNQTNVPDASNAFDGDHATAATIMTPDTEVIHFKAFIGGADTFLFKIKHGPSTVGSKFAIQGLFTEDTTWRPIRDINLTDTGNTTTVKVIDAQNYKDASSYINLRVRWEGGGSGESANIQELWCISPIFEGSKSTGTNIPEAAFDGNPDTGAVIATDWDGNAPFLNFKAYVGFNAGNTFVFTISHNSIGGNGQSLVIETETKTRDDWIFLGSYDLDATRTETVTVTDVQKYLDADGYISLRTYWNGYGSGNQMVIYEISRADPFFVGSKTTIGVVNPGFAVDRNLGTNTEFTNYWGEDDNFDFLHLHTYVGDKDIFVFYISAAQSTTGSKLVFDAEIEPDFWWTIRIHSLDTALTNEAIIVTNAQNYTDANGGFSMRIRWESGSSPDSGYIQEIRRE